MIRPVGVVAVWAASVALGLRLGWLAVALLGRADALALWSLLVAAWMLSLPAWRRLG